MNHTLKNIRILSLLLSTTSLLSSCFISSRSSIDVFYKNEYAGDVTVKTIRLPMLVIKPILKKYLKQEEEVPREIRQLVNSLKKVSVTVARTKNQKLINDFHSSVQEFSGEEWLTVQNNNQWIYIKADQNNDDIIKRFMVAISAPGEQQLIFLNMKCNLTINQLSMLINMALDSDEGKKVFKMNLKKS